MKNSLKTLKKSLRMGRKINIQDRFLARLPHPLVIKLSRNYGLIKETYKAGETIVSINGGDMVELAEDYKNGDTKIEYRNVWDYFNGRYTKRYDDDFGGTLRLMPCDLIFENPKSWKKYDHVYRMATLRELKCK